jgi:hypothetical protein
MRTFDIRFAKSEGLAALFEAPGNRRGWKGSGRLSIDSDGISIAMKRGLPPLLSRRPRRFAAHELTEVYREGDALRLGFGADDSREVLPIWTSGSAVAAEIVKLLPTRQTVELEHSTSASSAYRFDRPLFALVAVLGLAIAAAVYLLNRSPATIDAPAAAATPATVAREAPPVSTDAAEKPPPALPMARTSPAWPAARRHVAAFEAESTALRAEFVMLMESPSPTRMEVLAGKWEEKLQAVHDAFGSQSGEQVELGNLQAAICIAWREFLHNYAGGLRDRDLDRINAAFAAREQADVLRERMRWYVPD